MSGQHDRRECPTCSTDHFASTIVKMMKYGQISTNGQISTYGQSAYTLYLPWQTSNVARMGTFGCTYRPVLSCTFDSGDPLRPTVGRVWRVTGGGGKVTFLMEIWEKNMKMGQKHEERTETHTCDLNVTPVGDMHAVDATCATS